MLSPSPAGERHRPVMAEEVAGLLALPPGGVLWDLTVGDGGHAEALMTRMGTGLVMGLDRDPQALGRASGVLAPFGDRVRLAQGRFGEIARIASEGGWPPPNGVLMDLGASTLQLVDPGRGFSFSNDGPLDMRMDPHAGEPAARLVNQAPEDELARIFRELGEERWAGRIARAIVHRRRERPFERTGDLAETVSRAVPGRGRRHPATRVFQALRIAVNDELGELRRGLDGAIDLLPPGGRLAVISFHSLEDRVVKTRFREQGRREGWRLLTKKAVQAGREEELRNPRARSAKLRGLLHEGTGRVAA